MFGGFLFSQMFLFFVFSINSKGNTPLHWAALYGRQKVVKLLIVKGSADVNAKNNDVMKVYCRSNIC